MIRINILYISTIRIAYLYPFTVYMSFQIGHFQVAPSPCFKARLNEKPVIWVKMNFFSHANKTHFDKKGFALTL